MPSWLGKKPARIVLIVGAAVSWSFGFFLFFAEPAKDGSRITQDFAYFRMRDIMHALEHFRADCGRYPSAAEASRCSSSAKAFLAGRVPILLTKTPLIPGTGASFITLGNLGPK